MRLSEKLRKYADGELALGYTAELALLTEAADLLDAATPRPWPPPEGVSRCLGWDKENERWRVCLYEYRQWVFEDEHRCLAQRWCPLWLPMPPEPEVGS